MLEKKSHICIKNSQLEACTWNIKKWKNHAGTFLNFELIVAFVQSYKLVFVGGIWRLVYMLYACLIYELFCMCVCVCLILCNSVGRIDLFYRGNFYEQLKPRMGSEQTLYLIIRPSTFHHISKTFYLFVHPIFLLVFSWLK